MLALLLAARVPTLIWGPPGVGKTAYLEALAEQLGAELYVPHVRSPEDLAVPVARGDRVEVVPVAEFADAARAAAAGRRVVVFVDEITTLPPSVQAAVLRFLDSGRVGAVRMPPHVWRVAAANPPESAAGGWDLAAPVANRLAHVTWDVDCPAWARRFAAWSWDGPDAGGPVLEPGDREWDDEWARARQMVAGFVAAQPHLLHAMPEDPVQRGRAWPSPRTWEYASRVLAAARCDAARAYPAIEACVGAGAASQFMAWLQQAVLPTAEDLLREPALLRGLQRSDLQYAALLGVAALLSRHGGKMSRDTWSRAWALADEAAEVCRDAAAGTVVAELCRLYSNRAVKWPIPEGSMGPYASLIEEARGGGGVAP